MNSYPTPEKDGYLCLPGEDCPATPSESPSYIPQSPARLTLTPEASQRLHERPRAVIAANNALQLKVSPDDEPHQPSRPANAWILFRSQRCREIKQFSPSRKFTQGQLSKMLADEWKMAPDNVKVHFEAQADVKRLEHMDKYPNNVPVSQRRVRKKKPSKPRSTNVPDRYSAPRYPAESLRWDHERFPLPLSSRNPKPVISVISPESSSGGYPPELNASSQSSWSENPHWEYPQPAAFTFPSAIARPQASWPAPAQVPFDPSFYYSYPPPLDYRPTSSSTSNKFSAGPSAFIFPGESRSSSSHPTSDWAPPPQLPRPYRPLSRTTEQESFYSAAQELQSYDGHPYTPAFLSQSTVNNYPLPPLPYPLQWEIDEENLYQATINPDYSTFLP